METGLFDLLVSPNKPSSTISLKNYKAYFVVIVFLLRIQKFDKKASCLSFFA